MYFGSRGPAAHAPGRGDYLGGSLLPDLSRRYGDDEMLLFGKTAVSKRKDRTRVAHVKDPIGTIMAAHYPTTEVDASR